MTSLNTNVNATNLDQSTQLTSTTQVLNVTSKIDLAIPTTQMADVFTSPMIPGYGKKFNVQVAPDFDEPLDFGR